MKRAVLTLVIAYTAAALAGAAGPAGVAQDSKRTARAADASTLYRKHCDTCHGKDGRAKTFKAKFNGARDLTDAAWHAEVTDERLFNSVSNGRGKKMPSFKKKLTAEQIESLVAYVRGLKK